MGKYDLPKDASVEDLEKVLNQRYAVKLEDGRLESVLDRYQAERDRILSFIRERDLFPIPADQDMVLLRTPSFLAPSIPAGAMVSPAPFRAGTKTSLVYLTLSEELLDEHTELAIPNMMIHEGIPGTTCSSPLRQGIHPSSGATWTPWTRRKVGPRAWKTTCSTSAT